MEKIKVTVYKFDYEPKNYLCTFEIKNYKQIKRIKDKLREFIQMQEDYEHGKIKFYCFRVKELRTIIKETDL